MPAYDRPIKITVPQVRAGDDSVAAVLRFNCPPAEIARVQAFIDRLTERGIVRDSVVRAYDSKSTSAELYFP